MKLAQRIAGLEARLPEPDPEPSDYESYIDLSKALGNADHPLMGPILLPGGGFNPDMTKDVPEPDHCLSREQYEALTWSRAEQCSKWISDRCSMYGSNSVCIFMDSRLPAGNTITTERQCDALATTFEGFYLSDIEPQPDMWVTDFVVHVIETVNCWRSMTGKSVSLIRLWDWTHSVTTEQSERFREKRIAA